VSFRPYDRYRNSGVDWLRDVPAHWQTTRLRRLFVIVKRIAGTTGYDVLSVTQRGLRVKDVDSNDGQISDDYSKYQIVNAGDFVMNGMDLLTGYVDIARTVGVTSPDYRVFYLLQDRVDCCDRYFLYMFQMAYKQKIFYAFGQGASQLGRWRLPPDEFNAFIVPLPPHDEQTAVADFLDHETAKIDALIVEQQRLIALLKEKRQAVISLAVTKGLDPNVRMKDSGVKWLGEVPAYWQVRPLMYLTQPDRPIMYGIVLPGPNVDEGIPIVKGGDVKPHRLKLDLLNRTTPEIEAPFARARLRPGDIVYSIRGTIGEAELVPQELLDANITQDAARIAPSKRTNNRWLARAVRATPVFVQLEQRSLGAAVRGINIFDLKRARVPVPPPAEQDAIADYLDRVMAALDDLRSEAEDAIVLLQERRSALISADVTGKIDVRNLAAANAEAA
jgi:type I restriction enzyme S subunit